MSRLDRIRADQGARATTLEREAAASEERASLIEYNLEAVDAAIDAVNAGERVLWSQTPAHTIYHTPCDTLSVCATTTHSSLPPPSLDECAAIATGMDWRELETLIRDERRAGNPVAGLIHSLQLDQNKVTLLLSNLLDEEEVRCMSSDSSGNTAGRRAHTSPGVDEQDEHTWCFY